MVMARVPKALTDRGFADVTEFASVGEGVTLYCAAYLPRRLDDAEMAAVRAEMKNPIGKDADDA